MKVFDIMERNPITIPVDATYEQASDILYANNISGAPVVGKDGKLVGILSLKDLFRVLYPFYSSYYEHPESYTDMEMREGKVDEIRKKNISEFMTKRLITVPHHIPIMRAGAVMLAHNVHHLPVLENEKFVGLLTKNLIYRAILQHHVGTK